MRFTPLAIAVLMAGCNAPISSTLPQRAAIVRPQSAGLRHAAALVYVGSIAGTIDTFTLIKGQYQQTGQIQDSNGPEGLHTDTLANMKGARSALPRWRALPLESRK